MIDDRKSPHSELYAVRQRVETKWPTWSCPEGDPTLDDLVLASHGRDWDDGAWANDQRTPEHWAQIRADDLTRQEISAGRLRVGAPNVRAKSRRRRKKKGTGILWSHLDRDHRWVQIARRWLIDEDYFHLTAQERCDGIAALAPGKGHPCLGFGLNPHPGVWLPGKDYKTMRGSERQADLKKAHDAHQRELVRARKKGEKSKSMFSVAASAIYGEHLRRAPRRSILIANLWNIREQRRTNGKGRNAGWINCWLLLARMVPEYVRARKSDLSYKWRDWRGVREPLAWAQDTGILTFDEDEVEGARAYRFEFLKGWEDRLGELPRMPDGRRVAGQRGRSR